MSLQGTLKLSVSLPGCLGHPLRPAASYALLPPAPPPPGPLLCPHSTELPHEGASDLRGKGLCLALPGNMPQRCPSYCSYKKLLAWEPSIRLRAGAGLGRQAGVLWLHFPRNIANFSKCALQTATRTRVFVFSPFTISAPPTSRACLLLRPAHAHIGWCLLLYEFKLGFAFEFRRSVAAARLSREAGMCVLDSGCPGSSKKGSGCGDGGGGA